jgi:hypothetical protein
VIRTPSDQAPNAIIPVAFASEDHYFELAFVEILQQSQEQFADGMGSEIGGQEPQPQLGRIFRRKTELSDCGRREEFVWWGEIFAILRKMWCQIEECFVL